MSWLSLPELLVALVTGGAVAGLVGLVARPPPRLGPRLRPYTVAARTALVGADVAVVPDADAVLPDTRAALPLSERAVRALARLPGHQGDEALARRLGQSGLLVSVPPGRRVAAYRMKQLSATGLGLAAGAAVALAAGLGPAAAVGLGGLGAVVGVTRWPARLNRTLDARRERMRIELYTVNQVLALQIRAGSGVTQALQRVVERGSGALVEELAEVLVLHRGGRPLVEALEHAARATPEPNAARTYLLLANGVAYGADLADGLRALSGDVRRQRTEALKRAATRRRAAMLLPIIAILAPVMLLFVAAPLPSLVLGSP